MWHSAAWKRPIGCAAKYENTMYRAAVIYCQIVQESFYQRKYIQWSYIHIVLGQDDTFHRWSLICIFVTYLIRNRSRVCMLRSIDPFPSQWHSKSRNIVAELFGNFKVIWSGICIQNMLWSQKPVRKFFWHCSHHSASWWPSTVGCDDTRRPSHDKIRLAHIHETGISRVKT